MDGIRSKCAHDLMKMILHTSKKLSNSSRNPTIYIYNMSYRDTQKIINKIITALPDRYFVKENFLQVLILFIAKEYMLFACQEQIDDDMFAYHLIDFIRNIISDLDSLLANREEI